MLILDLMRIRLLPNGKYYKNETETINIHCPSKTIVDYAKELLAGWDLWTKARLFSGYDIGNTYTSYPEIISSACLQLP